jgi:hypothetical protein
MDDLLAPIPVQMTREEKLLHWASLVRKFKGPLYLFHRLEYRAELKHIYPATMSASAFTLAEQDTTFNKQGLQRGSSIADHMKFFGLNQQELHEFSCDCGGQIHNRDMADRMEQLAAHS